MGAYDSGSGEAIGPDEALGLLEKAIASQDADPLTRAKLLESLRANSASVLPLLDEEAADTVLAACAKHLDPAWLRQVWDMLLDAERGSLDAEMKASLHHPAGNRIDDAAGLGKAFAELLMPSLDDKLRNFAAFFDGLPEVEPEIYASLLSLPQVRYAGDTATDLARFGIIPSTISESALALSTLAAESGMRDGGATVAVVLDLRRHPELATAPRRTAVMRVEAIHRIAFVTDLWPETCDRLLDWIGGALLQRPLLVKGFRAASDDCGYRLIWLDHPVTLADQWRLGPEEAVAL